jgi:hypothetical protein
MHRSSKRRRAVVWHLSEPRDLDAGSEVPRTAGVMQLLGMRRHCLCLPLHLVPPGGSPSLLLCCLPGWGVAPGTGGCGTAQNQTFLSLLQGLIMDIRSTLGFHMQAHRYLPYLLRRAGRQKVLGDSVRVQKSAWKSVTQISEVRDYRHQRPQ